MPTKALNQAVKRNADRFPEDFMFRLTEEEWVKMRSQNVTASGKSDIKIQTFDNQSNIKENGIQVISNPGNWSQNVTSSGGSIDSRRSKTGLANMTFS